jgi:serine protease inhibitor
MELLRFARATRLCLVLSLSLAPIAAQAAGLTADVTSPRVFTFTSPTDASAAKIVTLMQADSYNYVPTKSPTVWMIPFSGDHLKDIRVVVTVKDSTVVAFVTLVQNQRLPVTTEFMRTLLEQNHEFDRIKLDREGDLSVRIDGSVRVMDAAELRDIVNQVRNASDEIYGMIEPNLLQ